MIKRTTMARIAVALLVGGLAGAKQPVDAQSDLEPTVEALSTQVAALQTAVASLESQGTSPSQTPVPTVESDSTSSAVPTESGDGTSLASPLPLGTATRVGDYDIRILEFDAIGSFDAGKVAVTIEFTYRGTETGTLWIDLTFHAIGEEGLGYSNFDEEHDCEGFSSSLIGAPEMFPGATNTADICWEFPREEAENLVIEIAPLFDFDNEARYFALR